MNIILRLLRTIFGGCRHRHTYRERRPLHGAQVLHLVCEDCGHAVPAIQRTATEHLRVVRMGAVRRAKVRRPQGDVVAIGDARRQTRVAS
jgi:hypothetical protein